MYAVVRFYLVWFWKFNPKSDLNRADFIKCHSNTSNIVQFYAVFGFFLSVCGFNLDRIGFEHHFNYHSSNQHKSATTYGPY